MSKIKFLYILNFTKNVTTNENDLYLQYLKIKPITIANVVLSILFLIFIWEYLLDLNILNNFYLYVFAAKLTFNIIMFLNNKKNDEISVFNLLIVICYLLENFTFLFFIFNKHFVTQICFNLIENNSPHFYSIYILLYILYFFFNTYSLYCYQKFLDLKINDDGLEISVGKQILTNNFKKNN